ncbi:MAG: methyltransferase domain-containing protein [Robiginitomaculum sp.]|nr:methyltransferase domain-containing protein [Robiginitomaculum sp.]
MGFYNRHILPHVLDCACATKPIRKQRAKIIPLAHGDVVEIGIGSGHNLPYYDQDKVNKLIGIDPDEYVWKKAAAKRAKFHKPLERLGLSGESIPLPDACADTVVVTYSLCTIPDPTKALREMKRLLKPGAKLLFCEHGQAPDANVHKWQNRIDPIWKNIAGGCHSGRDIPTLLKDAGLSIDVIEQDYIPGPKILSYNYWGQASG